MRNFDNFPMQIYVYGCSCAHKCPGYMKQASSEKFIAVFHVSSTRQNQRTFNVKHLRANAKTIAFFNLDFGWGMKN